ncbi:MAG: hypothetical protein LBN30_07755, partial [Oscillospiraceae bacterium]|nr:hypothetical protein [Oscillospiraceae bacterium]
DKVTSKFRAVYVSAVGYEHSFCREAGNIRVNAKFMKYSRGGAAQPRFRFDSREFEDIFHIIRIVMH